MKQWLKKIKWPFFQKGSQARLTIGEDPYGYSIDTKPRFPFRRLFERVLRKTPVPDDQQSILEELNRKGTVIYAMKYRSQLDFIYLNLRMYQLGLPAPSFLFDFHPYGLQPRWYAVKLVCYHFYHFIRKSHLPDAYESDYYRGKIEKGESGLFFLVGAKGYYQRAVLAGHDPLDHLLRIQKDWNRPIFIVPIMLLYTRDPGRERRGLFEMLRQREEPSSLRKLFSFLRSYGNAALEMSEPLNLQDVLPELSENISERRKQVFQLRRSLIESVDQVKRAVVGPTLKSKLELKEIILNHPRLETFMQRRARSGNQEMWEVRREADGYLDEIAADYNINLIQLSAKFLNWMWNNLFDGIEIDSDSLQGVKRAARNQTLIYIPCHKSHIDYLILSYILYRNNLYTPFIAAGKNLAFWPLGSIFRRCGAFFIRRTFKGARFYAEAFSLYVKTMVQLGHNIEFFIEGGRSRTGKMVLPKLGLLAILIQAVEEGFCEDLVFVPTSICYDRIPEEEAYLKEITGGAKVQENIRQLVRARRFLKKRYGRVYVKFAEPLSLQRYVQKRQILLAKLPPRQKHAVYRDISYRIINSINQASLVTPHALVASVLLSTSSHGITMAEFHQTCKMFYDYLVACEIRLSNTLNNYEAVIRNTLQDLERSKLIGKLRDEDDDLEEEVFTMEDTKRLTLEYYKNNIIHFLLPATFFSTSILAQQTFHIDLGRTVEDMAFMKNFFKFEFVYDNEISDEKLMEEVLSIFEKQGWLNRADQEEHTHVLTHEGLRAAQAFHGLLRNYFEGYWLVLRAFRNLQKKPCAEKEFTKKILSLGEKALKLELIERPESVSKIIFGNALKYYAEKGVIEKTMDKEKEQELYSDTGDRTLIQDYSKQISRFLRSPRFTLQ